MKTTFWVSALSLSLVLPAHPDVVYPGRPPVWRPVAGRKTDREEERLVGAVRKVLTERADISVVEGKLVEGRRRKVWQCSYTVKGNWKEVCRYEPDGSLQWRVVQHYDDAGGNTHGVRYSALGSTEAQWFRKHDDAGNVVESSHYEAGQPRRISTYTRNVSGKVTEAVGRSAQGEIEWRHVYRYDAVGNMIQYVNYRGDGSLYQKDLYTYDSSGNKTGSEETLYKEDGSVSFKRIHAYSQGNPKEEVTYNPDGTVRSKKSFSYGRGKLKQEATFGADGTLEGKHSYVYEYDAYGNWIKKTKSEWVTKDGKSFFQPIEVTYRKITYYSEDERPWPRDDGQK